MLTLEVSLKCGLRARWDAPGDTSVLLCYHMLALPARASLAAAAQMAHSVNTCWLLEMAPDPAPALLGAGERVWENLTAAS